MLTIRLTRKGKKNQPFFSVVVIDKRSSTKGGRAVEDLGYVDPLKKRKNFKKERILYWISKGAKTSATMHNFLVSEKIIDAKKINVSKKPARNASHSDAGGSKKLPKSPEASLGGQPAPEGSPLGTPTPEEKLIEAPKEPAQSPADNEAGKEPEAEKPAE